jgi:hypothetical protein
MHTSLILVALLGPAETLETQKQTLTWQDDYGTARQMGRRHDKPLAVFIGNGPAGWKKVADEGDLSGKAKRLLAQGYICLYVDRTRPGGKRLAESFEAASGPALVVSSRDGKGQVFSHTGKLTAGDLETRLAKYAGDEVISRTESLGDSRVSFCYDPTPSGVSNAPLSQPYVAPFGGSGFGGFGGASAGGNC